MTNYRQGRGLEYEVRDHLQAQGYDVLRSAGSKGAADLVGFKVGEIVFVQCKRSGTCPPAERVALLRLAGLVAGVPLIASRPPRQRIHYRRLTGAGPKDWLPWTADETASGEPA
ncbi:restriction endonuclease [Nocardia sp. NPDC004711]